MPNPDAMLVQTLQKYQQLTQKIERIRDDIGLIDEKKQKAAQPVSPVPFSRGSIITVEQQWQSAVPVPPTPRPLEHEVGDLEQQQKAVTVFQHTFPTSVYPSPATFIDKAPVQENPPSHSFSSSPSSPQFKVNSSHFRMPLSNVGLCTIIHGGHAQPPANDETDDDFQLLVSQIFEPSKEDGDSYSVLLSNELEEEFMNPICF
jgi:hypothetical protein